MRGLALVLAAALTASTATADDSLWARATRSPDRAVADAAYAEAMQAGDDALALAAAAEVPPLRERLVTRALRNFRAASAARPDAVEPHLRAARTLQAFYLDCARTFGSLCPLGLDRAKAEELIAEWDAIERTAPLEPRLTEEILFDRAILHTKLGTPEHLTSARTYYQRLLERMRGLDPVDPHLIGRQRRAIIIGNLAETHMMLGDLDQAIDAYRVAEALSPEVTRAFGLAVALDRDGQPGAAREVLRAQGDDGFRQFVMAVQSGGVFFVPAGEVTYYLGLGAEHAGDLVAALEHFEQFVRSGAHPRYQPRAREHIAALRGRLARPRTPR